MKLLINNEIPIDKWLTLISKSPYASAFQTPAFYELFNSVPGLTAEVFAIEEESVIIALCLVTLQEEKGIKGYFSRRAIIYGGPVFRNHNELSLEYLLTTINKKFQSKAIYLEIRNLNDYSAFKQVFERNRWKYLPYMNYLVDCKSEKVIWDNLSNNRRRQVKKAFKNEVQFSEAASIDEVNEFYNILTKIYRERIRKPLVPLTFFKFFYENNIGKIFLLKINNKIIGGSVCPILDQRKIYDWYRVGLDFEYKNLYPSTVAAFGILNFAQQNSISQMDFMGAGKLGEKYGVRAFKSEFGGELVEYGRYIFVFNKILYKIGKFSLTILSSFRKR